MTCLRRTTVLLTLICTGAFSCSTSDSGDNPGEAGGSAGTSGASGSFSGTSSGGSGAAGAAPGTGGAAGAAASGGTLSAGGTSGNAGTGAGAAGAGGENGGSVFPPSVTRPRIMIVGDSISAGPGCYKKYLAQNLTANGITNYEFVGEYTDDCGGGVRHSAVSCTTSASFTQASFSVPNCFSGMTFPGMSTLVATHNPDLILIQLGVNDVWGGSAPIQPILENYTTLVNQARAHNPNVVVMVAQIHKIITDNCANTASTTNAEQLVMAVPGWTASLGTAASPVLVADLWTNSDAHEADDCVHPNDAGARRMGLNWYNALAAILE